MSESGYAYATIRIAPGEPTGIDVAFYLDDTAWVKAVLTGKNYPFLSVTLGDVSVRIAPRSDRLTARDAEVARHFADQAALYAAEMERRCEAQSSGPAAA